MKKEIIVVIIIIIFICAGHIFFQKTTKSNFKEILDDLNNIEIIMSSSKQDNNLKEEMQKLLEKWEEKSKLLAVYIEHDELEKVEKELVSLQANIETKSYAKGMEDLKKCEFIIEHIIDKESLKLVNIF